MDEPPIRYITPPDNAWHVAKLWPLLEVEWHDLYLVPGKAGAIASLNDGCLSWDVPAEADAPPTQYAYAHPEWGGWPGTGTTKPKADGTFDPIATFATFSTAPLEESVEICGSIIMNLWAASDQTDTEFYIKLADQPPTGDPASGSSRVGVTRGWLRASRWQVDPVRSKPWRPFHDHRTDRPLVPNHLYELQIEIWPTSWVFKKGHRIRIEIAPGDSPLTDELFWHDFGVRLGTDSIFHDAMRPSHVVLPIVNRNQSKRKQA